YGAPRSLHSFPTRRSSDLLCLRRPNGFAEAFAHIEQAKSRSLMDLLIQPVHVASDKEAGQSQLVRSIRNLREELNWYYNLIERRSEEHTSELQSRFDLVCR